MLLEDLLQQNFVGFNYSHLKILSFNMFIDWYWKQDRISYRYCLPIMQARQVGRTIRSIGLTVKVNTFGQDGQGFKERRGWKEKQTWRRDCKSDKKKRWADRVDQGRINMGKKEWPRKVRLARYGIRATKQSPKFKPVSEV